MKFVFDSWRAAWIRRRAELVLTGCLGVGALIAYALVKWG